MPMILDRVLPASSLNKVQREAIDFTLHAGGKTGYSRVKERRSSCQIRKFGAESEGAIRLSPVKIARRIGERSHHNVWGRGESDEEGNLGGGFAGDDFSAGGDGAGYSPVSADAVYVMVRQRV